MGILLMVVGFGWALLGFANIVTMLSNMESGQETIGAVGLVVNMVLFVLPGLLLGALGWYLNGKKAKDQERIDAAVKAAVEAERAKTP